MLGNHSLLNYLTIDLSGFKEWSKNASVEDKFIHAKDLVNVINTQSFQEGEKNIINNYEIVGETDPLFSAFLFMNLILRSREIIYRLNDEEKALVVFSTYNEKDIIRPSFVENNPLYDMDELRDIEIRMSKDRRKDIKINLSDFKRENGKSLGFSMKPIYSYSPEKEKVNLTGKTSFDIFFLILGWFRLGTKDIYYEDVKIN